MECTQKLECTQELYASQTEAVCPEQIGFLGICGTKYPVKRGPNKVGRDASVCSIVLNLDSISRNHAVINIMNGREYMLMDLDSANKTRLNNKVLQPYIPYPLNNCDTVQFGSVFGVFRLLAVDHELPSTQAIDIPDTPAHYKHASRVKGAATTIPESPDVSDRDDSFIMPSQPKEKQIFKSPNTAKYIKNSSKTVAIQPIGSNQIDNIYWSSNKKSPSIDDSGSISNDTNDDSMVTANMTCQDDIHEMETQPPFINKMVDPNDSIYTADTQMPNVSRESIYTADTQMPNVSRESIYTADTQMPNVSRESIYTADTQMPNVSRESIYTADTQMPNVSRDIYTADTQFPDDAKESIFTAATQMPDKVSSPFHSVDTQMPEHLPSVQKICDQHDMKFDLYAANKENISVYNAETQLFAGKNTPATSKDVLIDEEDDIFSAATQFPFNNKHSADDYENDLSIFEADTQFTTEKHENDFTDSKQQKYSSGNVKSELNDDLENDVSIFEADTQFTTEKNQNDYMDSKPQKELSEKDTSKAVQQETANSVDKCASTSKTKLNTTSDEEILFDEIDGQSFEEAFESQPLIPSEDFELMDADHEIPLSQTKLKKTENETNRPDTDRNLTPDLLENNDITMLPTQKLPVLGVTDEKTSKIKARKSDEKLNLSTNTLNNDDISLLPTQKLSTVAADEDDATDCESSDNESKNTSSLDTDKRKLDSPNMSFEDMATQVLEEEKASIPKKLVDLTKKVPEAKINILVEDMATQVLKVPDVVDADEIPFEDMATQVLEEEDILLEIDTKNSDTKDKNQEVVLVDDDIGNLPTQILPKSDDVLFEDLPTQILEEEVLEKISSEQYSEELISTFKVPFVAPLKRKSSLKKAEPKPNVSPIVSTVKIPQNESSKKIFPPVNDDKNHYECTQDILEDLSSQQQESPSSLDANAAKVDPRVAPLKRAGSDSQDPEVTPKKVRPMKLMYLELPDSQEIKTSVSLATKLLENSGSQSSSESEPEQNSEEMTPIVFHKKRKKAITDAKIDLIKKFEASTVPTRVISRVRKPTAKLQESNILKSKNQTDSQESVDREIITENITRLKSKTDKKNKAADDSKTNQSKTCIKTETVREEHLNVKVNAEADSSANVSVKIEKSPKKVTKGKRAKKTDTKAEKVETNDVEIKIKLENETKAKAAVKTEKDGDKNKSPKKKNAAKGKKKQSKAKHEEENLIESKSNISEVETSIKSEKGNDTLETSGVKTRRTRTCRRNDSYNYNTSKDRTSKERSATPTVDLTLRPITKGRRKANNSKISDKDDTIDLTKSDTSKRKSKTEKDKQVDETNTAKSNVKTEQKETRSKAKGKQKTTQKQANKSESEKSNKRNIRQKTDSQKDTIDKYLVDSQHSLQKSTKSHEVSTVYSVSSDASISSDNTPLSMKRRAPNHIEIEAPSPKRTRSSSRGNMSLRATPARMLKTQHVLFTAFNNNDVKQLLEKLGAVIVTDVKACTMVLTMSIKRTFKLLCAVGLGVPIVGPSWVQACLETNMIVDPWQYILKDEACESRFQFSLQRTLAGKRGFLKGYNVSSTPKVLPDKPEMKLIVECSGGTWKESVPNWICVSNAVDKALWPDLIAGGATIVSTEFILCGVLKQVADVDTNKLA